MKKISLKAQKKDFYPLPFSYDFSYQILNENNVPIGVIFLSDTIDGNIYIEWLEILTIFRGYGYLRLIFQKLAILFNTEIHLQCSENLLRKYLGIGCEEHGIDDFTENYKLTFRRK